MKKLLSLLFLVPLFSIAQGIKFENGLSWEQIKQKAKTENKYIFVDCYATWCKPCKIMETEVYSNDSIGEAVNGSFVSLKVQMDTSKNDNEHIKKHYDVSNLFKQEYKIITLPTCLFFSPDGKYVHKEIGFKNVADFKNIISSVRYPDKQIFTQIDNWRENKLDYELLPGLIMDLRILQEKEWANQIAIDYSQKYLDKLPDSIFLRKKTLDFYENNIEMVRSKDRIFNYYYYNPDLIDSIYRIKSYSKNKVNEIIYQEEIFPYMREADLKGTDANWKKIKRSIRNKYNKSVAAWNVFNAQTIWYKYKNQWENYAKALVNKVETIGYMNDPGTAFGPAVYLNNVVWELFQYSNKKSELKKGLLWITYALTITTGVKAPPMDTKANLLYKLGRIEEAIDLETQVVQISPAFNETLNKMKNGTLTWTFPTNNHSIKK